MKILSIALFAFLATIVQAEQIGYHQAKLDDTGKLLGWYGATPGDTYDHVIRLVWGFWRDIRKCPNGVPYYLQHQVWRPSADDPRGLGGDQISMALSSWNLLYGYLGDPAVKDNMVFLADYWLDHGFSSPPDRWANLPYPYNTEVHSGQYDGDMVAGKGFLQPDKAGSFGAELITLYKMTGNRRYLLAAVKIADTLAKTVVPGDADHSPWPFRVNARTGEVHTDTLAASYTSNWTPTLRLFTALTELKRGNATAYRRASRLATEWLQSQPQRTNKWGPFFEDVKTSTWSDTEINADTLAGYILEHPEWSRSWRAEAESILSWTLSTFGNPKYAQWGVTAINEQTGYMIEGNSHSARHAAVELLYCEKTNDCASKQEAIRRLNWATYWVDNDGRNRYPEAQHWMTDGYGDYVRHFLRAMASAPELAPASQNHLLRTGSTIQRISYEPARIIYSKFDKVSTEIFKLGEWPPRSVQGGRFSWNPVTGVLTVYSTQATVVIVRH